MPANSRSNVDGEPRLRRAFGPATSGGTGRRAPAGTTRKPPAFRCAACYTVGRVTTGTQFVGEVLAALREPAGRDDPYPLYARLREFGPAVPGPDDTLVISGYRPAAALLRDHTLAKRPELSLVTAGYRDWQQ